MTVSNALFSFDGRLGRLSYFGYACLMTLIMFMGFGIGFAAMSSGDGGGITLGVILFIAALVFGTWVGLAIGIKRLHDMGLPGTHMIWIYLLNFGSGAVSASAPALGVLMSLASFGVALWMLFTPSVGDNQYGPKPA